MTEWDLGNNLAVQLIQTLADGSTNCSDTQDAAPQIPKIGEMVPYALIALASFFCGIGVLGLMLWNAESLTKLGLRTKFAPDSMDYRAPLTKLVEVSP